MRTTGVGSRTDEANVGVGDLVAGKYRIERRIGGGAMGNVFAARDETLQRRVALKLMSPELVDTEAASRFVNEARAAVRLESEHVARVLDVGQTEDGAPFMTMDLLDGSDLAQVLEERGRLPVADVVDWVFQALEAVAEAHSLGIVHRDLKPANLFLARRRDGTSIVKVLDFGISKDTRELRLTPTLTATAAILGSPMYMAPEQLRNAKTVDARTDIWAVGVVLYELLVGRLPFQADNIADLFVAILERKPTAIRTVRADVAPALEQVVMGCLARDVERRFSDVAALADALAPFVPAGGAEACRRIRHLLHAREDARSRPPSRRRSRLVGVLLAAAGVATLGAAGLFAAGHVLGVPGLLHRAEQALRAASPPAHLPPSGHQESTSSSAVADIAVPTLEPIASSTTHPEVEAPFEARVDAVKIEAGP